MDHIQLINFDKLSCKIMGKFLWVDIRILKSYHLKQSRTKVTLATEVLEEQIQKRFYILAQHKERTGKLVQN